MKPKRLFSEYLNARLSGAELRKQLAADHSRDAQTALRMLEVEDKCRDTLRSLHPIQDGAERLVDMVLTADSWVRVRSQKREALAGWFSGLVPALDVGGRSKPTGTEKKSAKLRAGKKTRSRRKSSRRPKAKG
jgi:hypothetical protein